MISAKVALLADRGVLRVTGEDAEKLLQGIITNDMGLLAAQPALHAALLTPQGKILFDFFVVRSEGGYLLETAKEQVPGLIKRLTMYKLRAKVEIGDPNPDCRVFSRWGGSPQGWGGTSGAVSFLDPRLAALGWRILSETKSTADIAVAADAYTASAQEYHAHRIRLGVPEGDKDYAFGDTFPHEANFDQLNGISFTKGCFVGQEVVSRMQHRGSVRKRIVPVEGDAPLNPGAEIRAGAAVIGSIGSVADKDALALVRLDRAEEAISKGEALRADGVAIRLRKPDWVEFELMPAATAREP
jgi:folate-binding protein YgfZ